jgi:DNA-binding beta-propeller fold protein YncE
VQKFDLQGRVQGRFGASGVGKGELLSPFGIAVDGDGLVNVVEISTHRVQKFDSQGRSVSLWGGFGVGEGKFMFPEAIAVTGDVLYVTDTLNHRIQKFNKSGHFLSQWTGFGFHGESPESPGQKHLSMNSRPLDFLTQNAHEPLAGFVATHGLGEREFEDCFGVAVAANGMVYAVETGSHRVLKFDQEGNLLHQWGKFGSGPGQFWDPLGIDVDHEGFVYVADSGNHRIQKFTADGVFVAEFGNFGSEEGELNFPIALAVSSDGTTIYVADTMNNRVQIFKKVRNNEKSAS